jgi:hypothetical protein
MYRLALLLLLLPVVLYAQPDTLWTRTLDSPGYSWFHGLCTNAYGGCIAVGEGPPQEMWWNYNLRLVWLDTDGYVRWDRLVDTGMDTYGRTVFPTLDGGFMVAGCLGYTDELPNFVFLMKLDDRGDVDWFRRYWVNTMGEGQQVAAAAAPDGGFVLLGTTAPTSYGNSDPLLIRVNADGDSLWSRQYSGPRMERGNDIIALEDGFAILAQRNYNPSEFWLIRTDLQGDTLWTHEPISECYLGRS